MPILRLAGKASIRRRPVNSALGVMEHDRWLALVEALSDQDVNACVTAVESIHAEATADDIPKLLKLLEDENFFVREAAAWPLAWLAGPSVLPQLLVAYQRGFDQGHDNDGSTGALLEIPALFPAEAKASLESLASSSDQPTLGHARWLLEFLPPSKPNDA